jgi:hypothetical protein
VEVIAPRKIFEKFFKNPLTNTTKCGIIYMSRGDRGKASAGFTLSLSENFLKNFSKTS